MKFAAKITKMGEGESKIKATADVFFEGGFKVSGIKICKGEHGLFIGMPSNSYINTKGEKKYIDVFHPTTKEAREALTKEVLSKYKAAIQQQTQSEAQAVDEAPLPPEPDFGEPGFEDDFEDIFDEPSM